MVDQSHVSDVKGNDPLTCTRVSTTHTVSGANGDDAMGEDVVVVGNLPCTVTDSVTRSTTVTTGCVVED